MVTVPIAATSTATYKIEMKVLESQIAEFIKSILFIESNLSDFSGEPSFNLQLSSMLFREPLSITIFFNSISTANKSSKKKEPFAMNINRLDH